MEPISGGRIRIRVSVDDQELIDTDLTRAYFRSKLGGESILATFRFLPTVPPDDDGESEPAEPVQAALRLTIDREDVFPVGRKGRGKTHPTA